MLNVRRAPGAPLTLAVLLSAAASLDMQAQGSGLVVPVPALEHVSIAVDSFRSSSGGHRPLHIYRPATARGNLPVVVFANGNPTWPGYKDWARLVTSRGFAGVLHEGLTPDPARTMDQNVTTSVADFDSVLATVRRRAAGLDLDASHLVIWAGSAQTFTGTPVALGGNRPGIRAYVLYYGSGAVSEPRLDVPVFIARAGLDTPGLNRGLDSLSQQLVSAGVAVTVANYPGGRHAFDIADSTAMTQRIIDQTLDFMSATLDPSLRSAIAGAAPEVRAMSAYASGRWAEAARLLGEVARGRPASASVAWRLGLAQLELGESAAALASLTRARELGQGGARDIGLPLTRAALRTGDRDKAAEWLLWSVRSFPAIRTQVAADEELAPLLNHPLLRGGSP